MHRFKRILWEAEALPAEPAPAEPAAEPALPATALTGGDEPAAPPEPAPAAGQGEGGQPDGDARPEAPDGYGLNFAEGVEVDTELLGQFQKSAHEMGLTLGQAQKVADLYAGHMAGLGQKYQEAQFNALNDYITNQNAELAKRPEFQRELTLAKTTLKEFGSDDLAAVLQQTALGSHPAMFDFVVKVGKALGEPGFKGGPGRSADPPLYERIWGSNGLGNNK